MVFLRADVGYPLVQWRFDMTVGGPIAAEQHYFPDGGEPTWELSPGIFKTDFKTIEKLILWLPIEGLTKRSNFANTRWNSLN